MASERSNNAIDLQAIEEPWTDKKMSILEKPEKTIEDDTLGKLGRIWDAIWDTTFIGAGIGMLYGMDRAASKSIPEDAEVFVKLMNIPDEQVWNRYLKDLEARNYVRLRRGAIVGSSRFGMFTTALGFPLGWLYLKFVEKRNEETSSAEPWIDENMSTPKKTIEESWTHERPIEELGIEEDHVEGTTVRLPHHHHNPDFFDTHTNSIMETLEKIFGRDTLRQVGMVAKWGISTVIGTGIGALDVLYRRSRKPVDQDFITKALHTPDERERYRLIRDGLEKQFTREVRPPLLSGIRFGLFTASFCGIQNLLAEKRGVHDAFNITGASSVATAAVGLVVPGSLHSRARNVILGSVLGAAVGFPLGWLYLKVVEKANEETS